LISKEEEQLLVLLHPLENQQDCKKAYQKARKRYLAGGIATGALFMCLMLFYNRQETAGEMAAQVVRNEAGEDSREEEYVAEIDGESYPLSVTVEARQLTSEEADDELEEAQEEIHRVMLSDGDSWQEVRHDLTLLSSACEGDVTVSYTFDDTNVIHLDGTLLEENIAEEGSPVTVTILYRLSSYTKSETISLLVFPPERTEMQTRLKQLEDAVAKRQEETKYEQSFTLPDMLGGNRITWSRPADYSPFAIGLLMVAAGILLAVRQKEQLKEEKKKRESQLIMDYPKMTGRMVLFLKCGNSLLTAWESIVQRYEKNPEGTHYVYEEMLVTYREIRSGVPASVALEEFGKRCGTSQYIRFGMLCSQNLRQGAKGLLAQLEVEAEEAYVYRMAAARKKGEEAMTKLLFPLMLLLLITMAVILVPAFLSF
jgi:hypothetical protein